ncbi:hypothetical protein Pint_02638 [Pistacia integerrima]|uniref:Uncharacterized protein n=1 Tax=Pistacia integerrima TaxID=434235 RepID=A0ACC0ZQN3_9ROSI|nr:hypothetical protein Pint_02638 [Pistacia integerrima]
MEAIDENTNNSIKVSARNQVIIPSSSSTTTSPSRNPRTRFSTYYDVPDISPTARIICKTLVHASPDDIESALSSMGIVATHELVNEVLKLSYNSPSSAVNFFRWAGRGQKLLPFAWNLMVDILGKNEMFEQMWDAIRSMKQEGILSLATFASVFDSYCGACRYNEAFMSFDVMSMYGVEQDVVAVNSILSVFCREGKQMMKALEFLDKVKDSVPLDVDSFAILLEGWDKEGNVVEAKKTFGDMVAQFGWSLQHISSYETFLTMLVRGGQTVEALKFIRVMIEKNCLPGFKFFSNALEILVKQNDSANAVMLWDIMVGIDLMPNLIMYNALIGLLCNNNDIDKAFQFLDEMVFHGAFPDSLTYNMIFKCLIKNKRVHEVGNFFCEMIKNEWPPTHLNCAAAISMLFDCDEPETAIEIWNYMVDNGILPLEESANALLIGLRNLRRLSEVRRFAEDMLDRRIVVYEVTMQKLKNAFYKENRSMRDKYDSLARKWKTVRI